MSEYWSTLKIMCYCYKIMNKLYGNTEVECCKMLNVAPKPFFAKSTYHVRLCVTSCRLPEPQKPQELARPEQRRNSACAGGELQLCFNVSPWSFVTDFWHPATRKGGSTPPKGVFTSPLLTSAPECLQTLRSHPKALQKVQCTMGLSAKLDFLG
jgi:hypothetical protein